jgi:hypothetical protein
MTVKIIKELNYCGRQLAIDKHRKPEKNEMENADFPDKTILEREMIAMETLNAVTYV